MNTPVFVFASACRSSSERRLAALRYSSTASAGRGVPAGPRRRRALGPGRRGQRVDQRVLRREHHVGRAEQRVGPRGEHLDVAGGRREADRRARAAADPVALHLLDRVGPVEPVQVGDQPVGVRGDADHPLLQRPPEDREVAPLGAAVGGDLLVGQDRAQAGAPVDQRLVAVGEAVGVDDLAALDRRTARPTAGPTGSCPAPARGCPSASSASSSLIGRARSASVVVPALEDLQEDPLRPPVERDVGGGHAPAVVVAQAQPPELAAHGGDVRLGGDPRVLAGLHRVLLGRQAEGVEAHRVQHVVAGHPLVAGEHVGADVAERVADVQPVAAGVREHVQHVELRAVRPPSRSPRTAARSGSARRRCPPGAQRSCQLSSISAARAASYRNLGWSAAGEVSGIPGHGSGGPRAVRTGIRAGSGAARPLDVGITVRGRPAGENARAPPGEAECRRYRTRNGHGDLEV